MHMQVCVSLCKYIIIHIYLSGFPNGIYYMICHIFDDKIAAVMTTSAYIKYIGGFK